MSKSMNRRKVTAVALAVIGVAGLSLASASQLNLTGSNVVQSGSLMVDAGCQAGVPVTVTFDAPTFSSDEYKSTNVTLGGILAGCKDANYKVTLVGGGATAGTNVEKTGVIPTAGGSIAVPIPGRADAITKIALTIYK